MCFRKRLSSICFVVGFIASIGAPTLAACKLSSIPPSVSVFAWSFLIIVLKLTIHNHHRAHAGVPAWYSCTSIPRPAIGSEVQQYFASLQQAAASRATSESDLPRDTHDARPQPAPPQHDVQLKSLPALVVLNVLQSQQAPIAQATLQQLQEAHPSVVQVRRVMHVHARWWPCACTEALANLCTASCHSP